MAAPAHLEIAGQRVPITNPDKVVFSGLGLTKQHLFDYYTAVADGALRGVYDRPMILKRFVKGIDVEAVFQKRAPEKRPDFVGVAELKYRSGTSAREAVFRLGPDEFLMLGDNSPKSKDGRLWGNSRGAARRHAVPRKALVGKAFYIYWPHGLPFLNDGQGFPGSGESMLRRLPILNRWFYHAQIDLETRQPALSDYPQFRVPFYPQFQRMKRIR